MKTFNLVIRISIPVPDGITPAEHCREAFEEEKPLLAVGEPLGEQVEDFIRAIQDASASDPHASVRRVTLALEPGREPGRPMTISETQLWERGFHAGVALTMVACEDELGEEAFDSDTLTKGEEMIAWFVGCEDLNDYDEEKAALALSNFCRLEWGGQHWVSGIPGNAGARAAALETIKPWEHNVPWGEEW